MVYNKKQENVKKEDDKRDIKKALDNDKNYYGTLSEDEKESKEKDLDKDPKHRKSTEN